MPTEVTRPGLFHAQVCSDLPGAAEVAAWLDQREMSSCRWELVGEDIMRELGAGDPAIVDCADVPAHRHYMMIARSPILELLLPELLNDADTEGDAQ